MSYKPDGYPAVSPYLLVEDANRLIAFLQEVFDGKLERNYSRPDGTLMHGEVRIDDGIVMIAQATGDWSANPSMIHVYVSDVDSVWQKALKAGAIVQQEPTQKDGESDKRGGFLGPCGNSWWISSQMES